MSVPLEALDEHVAIIGKTGAGKTYTAKGQVEHLLTIGRRVCVIDPTGVWWGLRSSADGRSPGFPVVVFGGDHADLPIGETHGGALAGVVARSATSCVIDVSAMLLSEQRRFITQFAETVFTANREALHLIVDEADAFIPQRPGPEQTTMLNRMDRIVRRGRARGFRVMLITQRPAVLNKDSLSQVGTLIALKLTSPQDRSAVGAWIEGQADRETGKDVLDSLPKLGRGEGWVWSPGHELLERTTFPAITTYDSSRTPEAGERVADPTARADLDLEQVRALLAEADAPEVAAAGASGAALKVAEERGRRKGFAEGHDIGERVGRARAAKAVRDALEALGAGGDTPDPAPSPAPPVAAPAPAQPRPKATPAPRDPSPRLGQGAQKLLAAILGAPRHRVKWTEATVLAVLSPTAGYTRAAINELRAAGEVIESPEGVAAAHRTGDERTLVLGEVVSAWADKVGGAGARILAHLLANAPRSSAQVASDLGLSPTAGYTRAGWKALRNTGLIEEGPDGWRLASILRELGQ